MKILLGLAAVVLAAAIWMIRTVATSAEPPSSAAPSVGAASLPAPRSPRVPAAPPSAAPTPSSAISNVPVEPDIAEQRARWEARFAEERRDSTWAEGA